MPGPCHVSNYETEWIQGTGARIDIKTHPRHRPSQQQIQAISSAVRLVPTPHLRDFDQRGGYIQFSIPGCTPHRGGGHHPGHEPWIRLSHACLSNGYNASINITFLHEMGHIVDAQYNAMAALRQINAEAYRLLSNTRHEGATAGPGEQFADCYMIFLLMVKARRPYRHPADIAAYQGAAARSRFEALLMSPAFNFWPGGLPPFI